MKNFCKDKSIVLDIPNLFKKIFNFFIPKLFTIFAFQIIT